MKCKSCGAPFDENLEDACPYCGAPLPEEILREREESAARERELERQRQREAEARERERADAEIAAEVARIEEEQRGLSPFSWIGGVIWVIIGFCLGGVPGIGMIFLLAGAHEEPGFCRNFLRVLNVILVIFIVLFVFAVIGTIENGY